MFMAKGAKLAALGRGTVTIDILVFVTQYKIQIICRLPAHRGTEHLDLALPEFVVAGQVLAKQGTLWSAQDLDALHVKHIRDQAIGLTQVDAVDEYADHRLNPWDRAHRTDTANRIVGRALDGAIL